VTSLAIEMLQFNPAEGHDLVDLCAGTGGFLMAGLNKIKKVADLENKNEKYVVDLACKSLKGIEIDSHVANLGNATFRTRTGDRKESFIVNHDSLKLFQLKNETKIKEGCHIKAATNPPFGAKITIKDPETLINYDLAKISNSNCDISNATSTKLFRRSPDILFIEQNIKILKAGEGQLAIIVPYQILSGPQVMYVRNWILKNTKVISIVDLPSETFQPHTGTKTALLVVERLKEPLKSLTEIPDYNIFMGIPKWIGHDRRGNPVYKKSPDGMETSEILSDFNEIEKSYKNYIKTGKSLGNVSTTFTVKVKDIIKDNELHLNASFYNPDNINKQVNLNHNDFDMVKLHELVDRVFCPGRFKRNYVSKCSNAVPFLGGSNITQLVNETDKWLKKDDPKLEQLAVKSGWLLITRSGTTGIISSVPELWNGYAISEHVIRIVPNTSKISPYYLLAYLKSPQCQAALSQGVFGSVIDEITPSIVENLDIPVPKDKKLYNRIVSSIEDAENARSLTLNNLYGAIDLLNEKLCA